MRNQWSFWLLPDSYYVLEKIYVLQANTYKVIKINSISPYMLKCILWFLNVTLCFSVHYRLSYHWPKSSFLIIIVNIIIRIKFKHTVTITQKKNSVYVLSKRINHDFF